MILGCSTMIAGVFFLLGLLVALGSTGAKFGPSLGIAVMTAGMAFVASMILFGLDRWRWIVRRGRVRRRLTSRVPPSVDTYANSFAESDRELAFHLRDRLAVFFDVPPETIGANDPLEGFEFDRFMPGIYLTLMVGLCEKYGIESLGTFPKTRLETVGDLVLEARILLNEKSSSSRTISRGADP